jgi:uncharacterized spore protein YtfJ
MAGEKDSTNRKPFRIKTVRGEPYTIGERTLIPVARILSYGRARATIGTRRLGGWAGGFIRVTPRAIVEQTPEGERRIAIGDATGALIGRMLAMVVVITLFFSAVRSFARRLRALECI